MSEALPLRCACGSVEGQLLEPGPRMSLRLVCYCRDCRSFAAWLFERGHQGPILDAWGGTEVVQSSPARVQLEHGAELLACMRLSDTGLMRWYTACCHTPVANTMPNPKVPFAGVISSFAAPEFGANEREALLGPVRARVNGDEVLAGRPGAPKPDRFPLGTIARSIRRVARSWRRGEQWPSPFCDAEGAPSSPPRVLSEAERGELKLAVEIAQERARGE